MTELKLDYGALAELSAKAKHEGTDIVLDIVGTADVVTRDGLESLLQQVHTEALGRAARCVVVDLSRLEFMNSSCFKSFVNWVEDVQALEADKQYRIKFLSNPELHWQKRSLRALTCFAADLISVESG